MAIHNNIRMQDYAKRDVSDPSTKKTEAEKQKEEMERQRETDANMVGMTPSTGASGAQTNGGGNQTDSKDYIAMLLGGLTGDYNTSYWDKNQNALLSNNRWGLNKATEHEKDYRSLINEYKNTNPLETDWGKAIMSQYGLDGDNAAKSEWADAAASNGGNIDSYAEANARRQKLSYLNSGINAVNDASNQRFSNMIGALEKMGVNTQQLLGISTSNAQSAMDAAANRYSDDTEATIANYNSLISGNSSAMSNDEIQSLMTYLRQVYKDYGESDLLNTAEIYEKNGVSSDVLDSIVSAITGESAATPEPTGEDWYPIPEFRQYFENSDEISGITGLPSWVQQRLRKEAEAKGISATKYAKGILSGDYEYPSWLKQAPYAD